MGSIDDSVGENKILDKIFTARDRNFPPIIALNVLLLAFKTISFCIYDFERIIKLN